MTANLLTTITFDEINELLDPDIGDSAPIPSDLVVDGVTFQNFFFEFDDGSNDGNPVPAVDNDGVDFGGPGNSKNLLVIDDTGRGFEFISVDVELDLDGGENDDDVIFRGFANPGDFLPVVAGGTVVTDVSNPITLGDSDLTNPLPIPSDVFEGTVIRELEISSFGVDSDDDFNFDNFVLNFVPEIETSTTVQTPENKKLAVNINANNGDGGGKDEYLKYEITGGADESLFKINENNGKLKFKDAPDFENPLDDNVDNFYEVEVTVTETQAGAGASLLSNTETFVIEVTDLPSNPSAGNDEANVLEDGSVELTALLINDSFGNEGPGTTPVVVSDAPSNGTAVVDDNNTPTDPTDDTITYTPDADFNGVDTFEYTIEDSLGATATATVTINVGPINDAGVAVDDTATTNESTPVAIDVVANDIDVDGDSLNINSVDVSGLLGNLSFEGDGVFTYDPAGAFDDLDAGQSATDSFTYLVGDGIGGLDMATVTVTVTGLDDVPVTPDADTDGDPWDDPILIGNLQTNDNLGTAFDGGDGEAFEVNVAGSAQVTGTDQADSITGGEFSDRISGGEGDDTVDGGASADRVAGNGGNDVVNGGDGDDFVFGNAGDDQVNGGLGDDRVDGGAGDDLLTGGPGEDLFVYDGRGDDVITDFEIGTDALELPPGADFTLSLGPDGTTLVFDAPLGTLTLAGLFLVDLDAIL